LRKTLIIGLDGVSWDVLQPLFKKNITPTLKKLSENGVIGRLRSVVPPVTGPSWLSIATGKNPGKTGIIDFLVRENNNKLRLLNANDFIKNNPFWNYIDKKKIIINYPLLFPPYEINGVMVSGVVISEKADFTFPKDIKNEIYSVAPNYKLNLDYHHPKYNNIDLFLKDITNFLDAKGKADLYLLSKYEWNLGVTIYSPTDWILHRMWMFIDPNYPLYPGKNNYEDEFKKFWRKLDQIIAKICNSIDEEVNILVISDHGFGPQWGCFNLGKWLETKGYLRKKKGRFMSSFLRKNEFLLKRIKTSILGKLIPQFFVKKIQSQILASVANQIDLNESKAYVIGHTIPFGAIYINSRNKSNVIRDKLVDQLWQIPKDIKYNVKIKIYEPHSSYHGSKVNKLPDIILSINDWACIIEEDIDKNYLFKREPFSLRHTGSHRIDGIFIAYGPNFKRGAVLQNASILDIAPTILHIFDIPIPKDMDGKVLKEIFKENSILAKKDINYQETDYERKRIKKRIEKLRKRQKI